MRLRDSRTGLPVETGRAAWRSGIRDTAERLARLLMLEPERYDADRNKESSRVHGHGWGAARGMVICSLKVLLDQPP